MAGVAGRAVGGVEAAGQADRGAVGGPASATGRQPGAPLVVGADDAHSDAASADDLRPAARLPRTSGFVILMDDGDAEPGGPSVGDAGSTRECKHR